MTVREWRFLKHSECNHHYYFSQLTLSPLSAEDDNNTITCSATALHLSSSSPHRFKNNIGSDDVHFMIDSICFI